MATHRVALPFQMSARLRRRPHRLPPMSLLLGLLWSDDDDDDDTEPVRPRPQTTGRKRTMDQLDDDDFDNVASAESADRTNVSPLEVAQPAVHHRPTLIVSAENTYMDPKRLCVVEPQEVCSASSPSMCPICLDTMDSASSVTTSSKSSGGSSSSSSSNNPTFASTILCPRGHQCCRACATRLVCAQTVVNGEGFADGDPSLRPCPICRTSMTVNARDLVLCAHCHIFPTDFVSHLDAVVSSRSNGRPGTKSDDDDDDGPADLHMCRFCAGLVRTAAPVHFQTMQVALRLDLLIERHSPWASTDMFDAYVHYRMRTPAADTLVQELRQQLWCGSSSSCSALFGPVEIFRIADWHVIFSPAQSRLLAHDISWDHGGPIDCFWRTLLVCRTDDVLAVLDELQPNAIKPLLATKFGGRLQTPAECAQLAVFLDNFVATTLKPNIYDW